MKKRVKLLTQAFLALGLLLLVFVFTRTPSLERAWDEDVAVLAGIDTSRADAITLTRIRDWKYASEATLEKTFFDASFDPNNIVAMWMYEQQLDTRGLIAHTFVVFEFDDSYGRAKYLGLSVETRREQGEIYSVLGGAFREFEITHIWATEKDLVTRRVQFLDYPLTRYRLELPAPYYAQIFRKFVEETQDLASKPQWYNTLSNNCTSSLIKYVNESEPDAIPIHYSYVLTGKVDEYLEELGYKSAKYSLHITKGFLESNALR